MFRTRVVLLGPTLRVLSCHNSLFFSFSPDAPQQPCGQQSLLPVCQISCNSCSKVSIDSKFTIGNGVFSCKSNMTGEKIYLGFVPREPDSGHALDGLETYSRDLHDLREMWGRDVRGVAGLMEFKKKRLNQQVLCRKGKNRDRFEDLHIKASLALEMA